MCLLRAMCSPHIRCTLYHFEKELPEVVDKVAGQEHPSPPKTGMTVNCNLRMILIIIVMIMMITMIKTMMNSLPTLPSCKAKERTFTMSNNLGMLVSLKSCEENDEKDYDYDFDHESWQNIMNM